MKRRKFLKAAAAVLVAPGLRLPPAAQAVSPLMHNGVPVRFVDLLKQERDKTLLLSAEAVEDFLWMTPEQAFPRVFEDYHTPTA